MLLCAPSILQFYPQPSFRNTSLFHTDERTAMDGGMGIEDALDRFGEQHPSGSHHPLGLASAIPQAPFVVEISQVTHAVDHFAIFCADLGNSVVHLAPNVFFRHRRAAHRNLADYS